MAPTQSMLVIAHDADLVRRLSAGRDHDGFRMRAETGTLARLNGRVLEMAADRDLILVQADPRDPQDVAALRSLVASKHDRAHVLAMADGDVSLADVQVLSDAGAERVMPVPASADALAAELARYSEARPARRLTLLPDRVGRGKIIVTLPARGGVGATTLSVNLAERLAAPEGRWRRKTSARVALVDLDLQFGSVGAMLDLADQDILARLAADGQMPDENLLRQAMADHSSGLRVLPAPVTFIPQDALQGKQVAAMLDSLAAEYDFVVVDLPHAVSRWIEPVVARADLLLMVTDSTVPSVRQCRRLIDLLTAERPEVPVRIVVSGERKPYFTSATQREAERALERPFWAWLPSDSRKARAAADQGRPLAVLGGGLSRAINRMARRVRREVSDNDVSVKGN